jgi:myosin-5
VNEQKEYQAEGIEWSFISFPSNQDALELIDAKKKGIFSMIDDECMMPQGSDTKLAGRMYAALLGPQGSPNFSATNAQKVRFEFSIRHYAGVVLYAVHSFLVRSKLCVYS